MGHCVAGLKYQVGNAAEHFTAVSVSVKDKLDLSISVAVSAGLYQYSRTLESKEEIIPREAVSLRPGMQVGSSIQIALFVIPVIQLLAWTIGKPMT